MEKLQGRYYDGILIQCEYSPVTDFREARCRDYDEDVCSRDGFCNFLHVKPVPPALIRSLEDDAIAYRRMVEQEKDDERRLLKKHKSNSSSSKRKTHDHESSTKRSKRSRRNHSDSSSSASGDDGGRSNDRD
jgi:splicing factor U2AF 35 kDa subunit